MKWDEHKKEWIYESRKDEDGLYGEDWFGIGLVVVPILFLVTVYILYKLAQIIF